MDARDSNLTFTAAGRATEEPGARVKCAPASETAVASTGSDARDANVCSKSTRPSAASRIDALTLAVLFDREPVSNETERLPGVRTLSSTAGETALPEEPARPMMTAALVLMMSRPVHSPMSPSSSEA